MKSFVKQQHRLGNDSQQASQYSIFFAVLIFHLAAFILIENDQVFFPKKEKPRERLVVQTIQLNPKVSQSAMSSLVAFESLESQSSSLEGMDMPVEVIEEKTEKIVEKQESLEQVKEEVVEVKKEEKEEKKKEIKKEVEPKVAEKDPEPIKEVEKPAPKEVLKETPPPKEIPKKVEKPIEKPKKAEKAKPKEVVKKETSKPKPIPKVEKEPPKNVAKAPAKPPTKAVAKTPVNKVKETKEAAKKVEVKDKDKLAKDKVAKDKAAKDKLAKDLLLQQEAKAKAAELALKAKRQESLQKAQANMAKINKGSSELLASNSNGASIALPKVIHDLHVDAIPSGGISGSFSSHEMSYVQEIASLLKLKLKKLPEYGNVRVKLVLNRSGGIVGVTVLNAENAKNSDYIEGIILKMKFPSFGDNFPNESSKSFDIKLVSDL